METDSARESGEEENGFTQPEIGDDDIDNVAEDFRDGLGLLSPKEKTMEERRNGTLDSDNDSDDNSRIRTVDENGNADDSSRIEVEEGQSDSSRIEVEEGQSDSSRIEVEEGQADSNRQIAEISSENNNFVEGHKEISEAREHLEDDFSEQEIEVEAPTSPSSSGYAGGRGSSSAASIGSASGSEEIRDALRSGDGVTECFGNGNGEHRGQASWAHGKRYSNEDETSISWRKRKKHFFVLSHSGKPIYSRYGDEHKLAGFSATLQAIVSFVENGGDHIKLVRAGNHQIIFLVKGPIYLVCISCTEEPFQALKGQLELLYDQMLLILTKSIDKCFEKNSKFDMTPLLGGTDVVFSSLIHAFSWNPATYLHAYTCLPLRHSTRQAAGAILQDVADSGVLFAILMCRHKVISLFGAQKAILHPDDMLLLSNFVLSSESFRTSESFSPICLPQFNPMAFLYAYVQYLEVDTYLMLLTTDSDSFFHLKECRIRIENVLVKSNVLSEVQRSMLDGCLRVEDLPGDPTLPSDSLSFRLRRDKNLQVAGSSTGTGRNTGIGGPAGLWHFMYRSNYLDQYVASEFSPPINSRNAQKRLFRAYQKLHTSMHDKDVGPHKMQYRKDENYVLLCWITQEFELYAAFDPLAEKSSAITVCNRVCQWLRDVESEIFLLEASPLSW